MTSIHSIHLSKGAGDHPLKTAPIKSDGKLNTWKLNTENSTHSKKQKTHHKKISTQKTQVIYLIHVFSSLKCVEFSCVEEFSGNHYFIMWVTSPQLTDLHGVGGEQDSSLGGTVDLVVDDGVLHLQEHQVHRHVLDKLLGGVLGEELGPELELHLLRAPRPRILRKVLKRNTTGWVKLGYNNTFFNRIRCLIY